MNIRRDPIEPDDLGPSRAEGKGVPWKLVALLVVVVLLAIFFFQNGQRAPVHFLWLDGDWPMWTVIGVSVVVGVILDRLAGWQWRRARRRSDDR